ncbi:MAG: universal stress protein [Proteobacteria bacterium]|nr:universal stress protein [Pseudomonadota bacterium]
MPYKEILVHIDNTSHNEARLKFAIDLAEKSEAHLVGLYVIPELVLPVTDMGMVPPDFVEMQDSQLKADAAKAEEAFIKTTKAGDLSVEWRAEQGLGVDILGKHARYCDLLILGQQDPDDPGELGDLADRLILSVGRPVLVVPYAADKYEIGKRVMVAWDSSAHASRAVHDALPLLEGADNVDVLAINPKGGNDGHGQIACADICLHLARHGVKAEAHSIVSDDIGVADMLLSRASDEGVDLFVMGAYGHSRMRELVLGGVTRHMLNHMTMPVLMAH